MRFIRLRSFVLFKGQFITYFGAVGLLNFIDPICCSFLGGFAHVSKGRTIRKVMGGGGGGEF